MLTLHLTLILTLTPTLILTLILTLTLTLSERNAILWRPVNYNLAGIASEPEAFDGLTLLSSFSTLPMTSRGSGIEPLFLSR